MKAEGVLLSGDGPWKEYCEGFAVGKCFGRKGKEPPGPGDGNKTKGVCKHETAEVCNGRKPHCSWDNGKCMPSCGTWLVVAKGYNDGGFGCRDTACAGRGETGVAYDCKFCCETWKVNGKPVFKDPKPKQLQMSGMTEPSWLDTLDQSLLRPRRAYLQQPKKSDNKSDTMALIPLETDNVKFYKFTGAVHEKRGGHLDPMTWGTPRITGMTAIDVDGDGRDELAINFETDDNIWFYRWDGTFHERSGEHLDGMGWGDPHIIWTAAGDFDGDGTDELAINYNTDDHVFFYRWKGEVKARDGPRLQIEGDDIYHGTTAGDFDGDGRDELAVVVKRDHIRFYRWNGIITPKGGDGKRWELEEHKRSYLVWDARYSTRSCPPRSWPFSPCTLGPSSPGDTIIYEPEFAEFGRLIPLYIPKTFPKMAAGDFNGDGRTELAVHSAKGEAVFYSWSGTVERRNADNLNADLTLDEFDRLNAIGQVAARMANDLDADCGTIEKQCDKRPPLNMLVGDFDGNGEGDIVVFVWRVKKKTTVMFYAWDGKVFTVANNHIDPAEGKHVLLAAVRGAGNGTDQPCSCDKPAVELNCTGRDDGYVGLIDQHLIHDSGPRGSDDSLEIYCRKGVVRLCLSKEPCPWRNNIASKDTSTCVVISEDKPIAWNSGQGFDLGQPLGTQYMVGKVYCKRNVDGYDEGWTAVVADSPCSCGGGGPTEPIVVTPEEYPDACPPSKCGTCRATALPLNIEIANLDAYQNAAKKVVDVLATVDPARLFIQDGACLTYTTPGMDCASVCRRCHGASASHCQAQAGVCVCEEGLTWHTTNVPCEAEDPEQGRRVRACCARMFNVTMALDSSRVSANGTDECVPAAGGLAAPYFDRCQTASSDTGWCCFDGFDELPVTTECIDQGPTCEIACSEEFPTNATLQERCVDRCRNALIDDEEEEDPEDEEEKDPEEEELEEPIKDCMELCLAVNSTEVCQRMCHALAPDLEVEVALLRSEEPVRALYVGEMLRASVRVRNRGLLTVSGNVSLSFQVQVNCTCPPCVRGETCACSCDEYRHPVVAGLRLGSLLPDAERLIPILPFRVDARFTNLTLAPFAEVRYNGTLLGYDRGDIHAVFLMDNLTVVNVHFVTPQGERTTRTYPGTTALGEVTLVTTVFPLAGNLTVMRSDGPVNGSLAEVTIDQPGAHTLRTPVINITNDMAGHVLGLRAELHDVNGFVLITTFQSQGEVLNECAGRSLTSWCREDLAHLATVYPHAYLEVARPSLLLRDAYFTDARGVRTSRLYRPEPVKGHVEVGNPEPVAFTGELLLRPVDASGSFLDEQVQEPDMTLDPKAVSLFETPPFTPVAGEHYRLLVSATPPGAGPWLDELVNPAAHPFAELEVGLISLDGEEGHIATVITTGNCTREVICEECLSTCRFRLNPRTCELVPENCACGCAIT